MRVRITQLYAAFGLSDDRTQYCVWFVAVRGAVGVAVTPEQLSYALTRAALRVVLAAVLAAALARG